MLIAICLIAGLTILISVLIARQSKVEPVTLIESASLRELTIDEKIEEAQLIVIGEVKTTLSSKWKFQNENDPKGASPQDVLDAGGLFSDSILSVNQLLKGNIDEPDVRIRSFIGETERVRWQDSSQPLYISGNFYLLFLRQDTGPTSKVEPGYFRSVNANTAVYEIVGDKAISADDEWLLEDLIAYIEKFLSGDATSPSEPTLLPTESPIPTETPTATP